MMRQSVVKICAALALAGSAAALAAAADFDAASAGRSLYLDGAASSTVLLARRAGGFTMKGADAACANCHRRSGYGGSEGRNYIPPIDAKSLFEARAPGTGASASGIGRPAYTEETLARAIRAGIDPSGRPLDYLMPRYEFDDAAMRALITHLRGLGIARSTPPGDTLHFATIVVPGTNAERSSAMTEVLRACFDEHNAGPPAEHGRKRLGPGMSLATQPKWQLHVWNLKGEKDTWPAQLTTFTRRDGVFALVGGLGNANWNPVHEFCEANGVPCIFPRVEAPVIPRAGFYALYLSRGVLLEASLIARDLTDSPTPAKRVLQVMQAGDEAATTAAQALRATLAMQHIDVEDRRIDTTAALDEKTLTTPDAGALVLWLRPDALRSIQHIDTPASRIYLSATLADPAQSRLAPSLKSQALIAYPYELPEKREQAMSRFRTWLRARELSLRDEAVQVDAYTACNALQIGMNELAGRLNAEYLVERLEVITELGAYTGLYPRLALGIGQRFASKSGYLVRYAGEQSSSLVAAGERIAP